MSWGMIAITPNKSATHIDYHIYSCTYEVFNHWVHKTGQTNQKTSKVQNLLSIVQKKGWNETATE